MPSRIVDCTCNNNALWIHTSFTCAHPDMSHNVHFRIYQVSYISDIDECASGNSNDCDTTSGTCSNNEGGYTCTCNSGYQQGDDERSCTGNYNHIIKVIQYHDIHSHSCSLVLSYSQTNKDTLNINTIFVCLRNVDDICLFVSRYCKYQSNDFIYYGNITSFQT